MPTCERRPVNAEGAEPGATADAASAATRRVRPPRSRISPQRLAARRGGALEGLAWLGRAPEAKASLVYRATRLVARAILFGLLRFRIDTSGQELLPRGGYLLIA